MRFTVSASVERHVLLDFNGNLLNKDYVNFALLQYLQVRFGDDPTVWVQVISHGKSARSFPDTRPFVASIEQSFNLCVDSERTLQARDCQAVQDAQRKAWIQPEQSVDFKTLLHLISRLPTRSIVNVWERPTCRYSRAC